MKTYKKAIALCADNHYMDKVETLIKSVSVYNHQVRFYVFNDELPTEWFQIMQKHLSVIGSEIVNIKITAHSLKNYHLPNEFLSYATFFRYFIADFVVEDQIVYLDSDMIVTDSLDDLFYLDLKEYPIAAVRDYIPTGYLETFNAGMLVIPTKRWREENISHQLLALTEIHHENTYGDQGILNMLFGSQWLHLDKKYNFMVGIDNFMHLRGNHDWFSSQYRLNHLPVIIHYTMEFKPWTHLTLTRFRKVWWFYYGLSWSDILLSNDIVKRDFSTLVSHSCYHACIFTNSANMEQLDLLLDALPEVHFSILAYTDFAPSVIDQQRHLNLSLYPNFSPFNAEEVLENMDFYLDINDEDEIYDIIQKVKELEKPIFAFTTTSHDNSDYSQKFEPNEIHQMIDAIKTYLKEV